jgi:predicted ester cyclase
VDLEGYTENCVGLTGWTTGFAVAWRNFQRNMIDPFSDMTFAPEEVVEGQHAVVVRQRVEATHTGAFLGIAATGRRIAWDTISIVHVRDGRVVGQWVQADLYGIVQQLTAGA